MSSVTCATFRCPEWVDSGTHRNRELQLSWHKHIPGTMGQQGFVVAAVYPDEPVTDPRYAGAVESEDLYQHADHDKALSWAVKKYKALRAEYNAELQKWSASLTNHPPKFILRLSSYPDTFVGSPTHCRAISPAFAAVFSSSEENPETTRRRLEEIHGPLVIEPVPAAPTAPSRNVAPAGYVLLPDNKTTICLATDLAWKPSKPGLSDWDWRPPHRANVGSEIGPKSAYAGCHFARKL